MTLPSWKSGEALYTVILRDPNARNLLTKWSTTSRSIQCKIDDNKMHVFDHDTLMIFLVTWSHSWDNMVIWDTWAKRHINL